MLTSRVLVIAAVNVGLPSGILLLQLDRETFVAVRGDCVEHTGERLTVSIARHPAPDRGATRRGLRRDKKSAGRPRKEPVVVFASLQCSVDRASPSARHKG